MTSSQTAVKNKQPARDEIAEQIAAFKRSGGKINKVKSNVRGYRPDKSAFSINGNGMA